MFCLAALVLLSVSCKKENKDIIEETYEDFQPSFLVTLDGEVTEYDAYASYCNENGKQVIQIGTSPALLDTFLSSALDEMDVNDFLLIYISDENGISSIAGAKLEQVIGGQTVVSIVFSGVPVITIDEANSNYVKGSLIGDFQLLDGTFVDFAVEFSAEVIQVDSRCE